MRPEEFNHYIDVQLRQGVSRGTLVNDLLAGGWNQEQIDKALAIHDERLRHELTSTGHGAHTVKTYIVWTLFIITVILAILFFIGSPS